jgi:hypothetical protein
MIFKDYMNLFLPDNVERVVPDWFRRALAETDPNLIVCYNPMRKRWVIDRCTRGGAMNAAAHTHTPECPRTNVTVVQEEDRSYKPLCQAVIDDLRSRDTWTKYGSAEKYHDASETAAASATAEIDRKVDELYSETTKDNRRQLLRAFDIMQNHDLARVNQ